MVAMFNPSNTPDDVVDDPSIVATPPAPAAQPNAFVAGLKSGSYNALSGLAGAGSGAAKLVGADALSGVLGQKASEYSADAQQVGRPDLDKQGFTGNGLSGFLSKAAYTAGQAIPGIAGAIGGGALATAALPEGLAVGGGTLALGRLGASLPEFLGGSGLGAGFAEGASAQTLFQGARTAAGIGGAGAVMGVQSSGENVNAAAEQPGGLTYGNAAKAFALGIPTGLIQGIAPAEAGAVASGAERAAKQTLTGAIIDHGFKNAAAGAIGSGLQAAATTSFDPNISPTDRASQIVDAAVSGGAFGGVLGGITGMLHASPKEQLSQIDNMQKAAGIDPTTPDGTPAPAPTPPAGPAPAAPEPVQAADAAPVAPTLAPVDTPVAAPTAAAPAAALSPDAPTSPLDIAAQVGIKLGKGESQLRTLLESIPATNAAELHNALLDPKVVDPTSELAGQKRFTALTKALGIDDGLDAEHAKLEALQNGPEGDAVALAGVRGRMAIRDHAASIRVPEEAPTPEPAPEPAPAAPGTPITAPEIRGDIPGLDTAPIAPTATDTPETIRAQLDTLLGSTPAPVDTATPTLTAVDPASRITLPPDTGPKPIADRVLDAAREAAGPNGGRVSIADIRAKLSDLSPKDVDAALKTIHADDNDHVLRYPPKGETGVLGRYHSLDLAPEAADDAGVQVGSAAPQAEGDAVAGAVPADGGADASGLEAPRAGEEAGAAEGQPGATPLADGQDPEAPVETPEHQALADKLGVDLSNPLMQTDAGQAVRDRLDLMQTVDPRSSAYKSAARDVQDTFGKADDPSATLQPLDPARYADPAAEPLPEPVEHEVTKPQDTSVEPSPEQRTQTVAKTSAAENLLTAPSAVKAAADDARVQLRKQTVEKTKLVKGKFDDQLPTAAVGGDVSEIPQAGVSATDTLQVPGPSDAAILPKVATGRMPGIPNVPMARADVQAHVDRFTAKLDPKIAAMVKVVGQDDRIYGGQTLGPDQTGLYIQTKTGQVHVYVNTDHVHSRAEIEDVLSHELFGHYGNNADLRGPFRERAYQSRMNDVFRRAGGMEGVEALARKLGVWAPDDGGHNLVGNGGGLSEYLPEGGRQPTPFETARIVDELIAHRAAVNPSKLDLGIQQVQGLLKRAIVNTLRKAGAHEFARRMDTFGQAEMSDWVNATRKALTTPPREGQVDLVAGASTPRDFVHGTDPTGEPPFAMARQSARQKNYEAVIGAADAMSKAILKNPVSKYLFSREGDGIHTGKGFKETVRDAGLKVMENLVPNNGIVEHALRIGMPSLVEHYHALKMQSDVQTRINGVSARALQDHVNLRIADREQEERVSRLMAVSTANDLDPERPFDKHAWHAEVEPVRRAELAATHAEMLKDWDRLAKPGKGGKVTNGQQVFRDQRAVSEMNWYMKRVTFTHDTLKTLFDGQVDAGVNPVKRFSGLDHDFTNADGSNKANALYGNPAAARDYWKGEFHRLNDLAQAHSIEAGAKVENAGTNTYTDLSKLVSDNTQGEKSYVQQGPYFRLGRDGDYGVGFSVKPELGADDKPTGRPDPASLKAVQDAYAKDFPQIQIGASTENGRVFARFMSEEHAKLFHQKVAQGGDLFQHIDHERGSRINLLADASGEDNAVPFLQQHLDAAKAKFDQDLDRPGVSAEDRTALLEQRDKYLGNIRATILDLSGENSMRSIQSQRENVQGANADMIVNQRNASSSYARAASTTAFRPDKEAALAAARKAIDDRSRSGTTGAAKSIQMKRTLNAYNSRNAAADVRVDNSFLSTMKAGIHTYQLGASPAYIIMNMSQLGTLALPELARFHSFGRAVPAMVGALGTTSKIVRAMAMTRVEASDGSKGARAIFEGGITPEVLKNAGISQRDTNSMMELANHGHLELSSYSAANAGLGVGSLSRVGRFQHYANSTALLAETASRLVTALAAMKLHDEMPAGPARDSMLRQFPTREAYAGRVVAQSMLEWGSYNTPKVFTAGGALGKAGPLVTQFHGFVPRLVETVYRNAADGFTSRLGDSPEALQMKKEAQRFTLTHLAGVTAISGALGLPMAGYAAGAATRLSGLVLNQPYDFEAHMREFLASTLGKDVGEIVSRGLPRYLGVDMADLGDNDFAPLARIMEDRRKLEDAVPDYLAHAWGSAPGAAMNMVLAARELMEGRVAEAGARALPTSMRNLVRAYQVSERGYVSGSGEKLPVSAGAAEVLKAAFGLKGGALAEERERQEVVTGLKDDRQYREGLIKRDLTIALSRNNQEGIKAAMDEARRYDKDNPGVGMLPAIQGFMQRRATAQAFGQTVGVMGSSPKDRTALSMIKF